jgi:hypothetical protein
VKRRTFLLRWNLNATGFARLALSTSIVFSKCLRWPCSAVERDEADMTLQYLTRPMWEDREWQQRIRLFHCLLLETVDWWCRTDEKFPVDHIVAFVLYLFSPRCQPFRLSEVKKMREQLDGIVGTSAVECSLTWPRWSDWRKSNLIDTISRVLSEATARWDDGQMSDPSIEMTCWQIVDQIVAQKYVVFHHYHTTKRDYGGFFGSF